MKQRIFIALPISESLQSEILSWQGQFPNLPVRWLKGKNLHITLVPPFYVNEQELEKIEKALQAVGGFGSFEISFSNVTFGPDPRRPRLIWTEGETPKELIELQQKLQKIFGKEPEKRPFRLHLTIARFRPETFSSFQIRKLNEKVDWRDKVNRVVLFESRLSRDGADYEVLQEVLL